MYIVFEIKLPWMHQFNENPEFRCSHTHKKGIQFHNTFKVYFDTRMEIPTELNNCIRILIAFNLCQPWSIFQIQTQPNRICICEWAGETVHFIERREKKRNKVMHNRIFCWLRQNSTISVCFAAALLYLSIASTINTENIHDDKTVFQKTSGISNRVTVWSFKRILLSWNYIMWNMPGTA